MREEGGEGIAAAQKHTVYTHVCTLHIAFPNAPVCLTLKKGRGCAPALTAEGLHKSNCGAILSQKDDHHLKQNQPLQEGGKTYLKQSLVTGTNSRKMPLIKKRKKASLVGRNFT